MFVAGRRTITEFHEQGITRPEFIWIILEAKEKDGSANLLTLEHFQEMINFEEWLMSLETPPVPGKDADTFFDLCD